MCQLLQPCWPCDLGRSRGSGSSGWLPDDSHRLCHVGESAAHVVHRRAVAGVRHLMSRDHRASALSCVCLSSLSAVSDVLHATACLSDDMYSMGPGKCLAGSRDGRRCPRVKPGPPPRMSGRAAGSLTSLSTHVSAPPILDQAMDRSVPDTALCRSL